MRRHIYKCKYSIMKKYVSRFNCACLKLWLCYLPHPPNCHTVNINVYIHVHVFWSIKYFIFIQFVYHLICIHSANEAITHHYETYMYLCVFNLNLCCSRTVKHINEVHRYCKYNSASTIIKSVFAHAFPLKHHAYAKHPALMFVIVLKFV